MKLVAFHKGDMLVKAYETEDGADIVAMVRANEFWFSTWQQAIKRESILRAIRRACEKEKINFSIEKVVFI